MSQPPAEVAVPLPTEVEAEIRLLAKQSREAGGIVMKGVQGLAKVGGGAASGIVAAETLANIEASIRSSLEAAFQTTASARQNTWLSYLPDWGHQAVVTTTGAVAGVLPFAGAMAELPFTIGMIFSAVLEKAEAEGFDVADKVVQLEALRVFADGLPGPDDDSFDMGLIALRVALASGAFEAVLARAAAQIALVLGPKLAAGTVPVLSMLAGGAINYAFMEYYQEAARIRFRLLRIAMDHDERSVEVLFGMARKEIAKPALKAAAPASR